MNDSRTYALIFGLVVGATLSPFFYGDPVPDHAIALTRCTERIDAPQVLAKAAYVYDVSRDTVLYEKASLAQLPLASLTKLMTVDTALSSLELDDHVTISDLALAPEGESGLIRGEKWKAGDLADYSLIESSNDGAHALALAATEKLGLEEFGFVDLMNRRARSMGLTQTYFLDDTGLDISAVTAGAYGSARDVAHLLATIAHTSPRSLERSVQPEWTFISESGKKHEAENTSLLAALYPGAIGSKTGYTDLAGGNLALLFEPIPGRQVAIVALGSTREGRVEDVQRLADFAQESVQRSALCNPVW